MNKEPILTLIIPSYNTSKYVDECVPTYVNDNLNGKIKVLFVDDGGNDDTFETLKPYKEKYPNLVYLIHKDNGGHGSVINYCVYNLITTKYFKIIDGDDWVDTNGLVKSVEELYKIDDDLVLTDYKICNGDKIETIRCSNDNAYIDFYTAIVKTSAYKSKNILLTEKVFYDDMEFSLNLYKNFENVRILNHIIYCYRLGNSEQSVSMCSRIKHYDNLLKIIDNVIPVLEYIAKQDNNELPLRYFCGCTISRFIIPFYVCDKNKIRNNILDFYNNVVRKFNLDKYYKESKLYKFIRCFNFRFIYIKRLIILRKIKN